MDKNGIYTLPEEDYSQNTSSNTDHDQPLLLCAELKDNNRQSHVIGSLPSDSVKSDSKEAGR